MTFGTTRPVIVLPLDARAWSEAELRRALMHEIEHIQRGDWLMQIVARTVSALVLVPSAGLDGLAAAVPRGRAVVRRRRRHQRGAGRLCRTARDARAADVRDARSTDARHGESQRLVDARDGRARRSTAPRPRRTSLAAATMTAAALVVITVAPVRAIATADRLRRPLRINRRAHARANGRSRAPRSRIV